MAKDKSIMESYAALALQLTARSIEKCANRDEARAQITQHIASIEAKIRSAQIFVKQYTGLPVKLLVLPEYLFTSYPAGQSIAQFTDLAAFEPDGAEYDQIAAIAERCGVYLAGNAYESDPNFPDIYFQACFIFAPNGERVLKYRRLISMFAPTPHDYWDRYLDLYGLDGVFPVARTEIGNLAAIASEEILYPEIARALALRGAEIFAHPSSEIGSPLATPKAIARQARAFENMAYIVSANTAGICDSSLPLVSADGNSQFVDYHGKVIAESNGGETLTAFGEINLSAQRAARRRPAMTNTLARQANDLFAPVYGGQTVRAANGLTKINESKPEREYFIEAQRDAINRLIEDEAI